MLLLVFFLLSPPQVGLFRSYNPNLLTIMSNDSQLTTLVGRSGDCQLPLTIDLFSINSSWLIFLSYEMAIHLYAFCLFMKCKVLYDVGHSFVVIVQLYLDLNCWFSSFVKDVLTMTSGIYYNHWPLPYFYIWPYNYKFLLQFILSNETILTTCWLSIIIISYLVTCIYKAFNV